ncbi:MAG: 2,3-bisphosphoglycerate-independent phosphoglycerate mutase [Salibacteraceae bacterium]
MSKKLILMIFDGYGIAKNPEVSAIESANTPFVDSLYSNYPHAQLEASGLFVGLPDGQMGNSEVGHMNLGAGRVVYQDIVRINKEITEGEFNKNPVLVNAFETAIKNNKKVHVMGLLSNGGIHSHINHLKAISSYSKSLNFENLYLHAFMDGRDTDPKSGKGFLAEIEDHFQKTTGKVASIIGRYYAMDRDNRWERVQQAYHLLVNGKGAEFRSSSEAIQASYDRNITDEFAPASVIMENGNPVAKIAEGDVIIHFNFRSDRARELTAVLTQGIENDFGMKKIPLQYNCMTNYDSNFKGVNVLYRKDNLHNTLGQVVAAAGKSQIRIAETEKYPHVTYFFNGGRELPFDKEKRIMVPSPKVATYDLQPEMSAHEVRYSINSELKKQEVDFVVLNFANPDMVGHTGVFEAAEKAVETVDECGKSVIECGLKNGYATLLLADHGNVDCMRNEDGTPNTAHSTQPVPWFFIDNNSKPKLKNGKLADVAPTILNYLGIDLPDEMDGEILFE